MAMGSGMMTRVEGVRLFKVFEQNIVRTVACRLTLGGRKDNRAGEGSLEVLVGVEAQCGWYSRCRDTCSSCRLDVSEAGLGGCS